MRIFMLIVGTFSLLMTVALILFSFLAFTPIVNVPKFLQVFFICLCVKAITWSPFIGMEFYDIIFEHLYHDVSWMLNPMMDQGQKKLAKNALSKKY